MNFPPILCDKLWLHSKYPSARKALIVQLIFGKNLAEKKSLRISAGLTQGFQVTRTPRNSKRRYKHYPSAGVLSLCLNPLIIHLRLTKGTASRSHELKVWRNMYHVSGPEGEVVIKRRRFWVIVGVSMSSLVCIVVALLNQFPLVNAWSFTEQPSESYSLGGGANLAMSVDTKIKIQTPANIIASSTAPYDLQLGFYTNDPVTNLIAAINLTWWKQLQKNLERAP